MNDNSDISISNYRAIDEISFTPRSINILVGPNNSGKSSVLEAISLLKSGANGCKDSLGTSVPGVLIKKYSMDYLFHDVHTPIMVSDGDSLISVTLQMDGYPKDSNGALIQDYVSNKLQELFFRPDNLRRYKSRFLEERNYLSGSLQRAPQFRIGDAAHLREQPRQDDLSIESTYNEKDFDEYIISHYKKTETDLFHQRKLIISGYSGDHLVHLSVVFSEERSEPLRGQEKPFDLFRYYPEGFVEVYSVGGTSAGFVSGCDIDRHLRRVDKLHDEVVRRNLISESHNRIISKISYIEDIRKTDEGLYVSLSGHERTIPLASMGDGFKSMLKIVYLSVLAKNGVITLEEPELSLHPGYIEMLADAILFCSKNTQFFITTHSEDLILSLLEVAKRNESLDSIQIIKMHPRLDSHTIEIEEIPGAEALDDIKTINIDLRGV